MTAPILAVGEHDLEKRRMVGTHPADAISAPYAELVQPVGDASYPTRELAIRHGRPAMNQRGPIGR